MRRFLSLSIVFLLLFAAGAPLSAAYRFDRPQARIDRVDLSRAPVVRLFVSLLDEGLHPAPLDIVERVEVRRHREGDRKGEEIKVFEGGQPVDGRDGEVLLVAETGDALDTIVVAPGHQGSELAYGALGRELIEALGKLFEDLPATARANVIWYHDQIETWVQRPNKEGALSVLSHPSVASLCQARSDEDYVAWGLAPDDAPPHPCGLFADYGALGEILARVAFRGFFPRLLAASPLPSCRPPQQRPVGARHQSVDAEERAYGGAIDEALRSLVIHGEPGQPKRLILLTDGRDGYLDDQEDCRTELADRLAAAYNTAREACAKAPDRRACQAQATAARDAGQARSQAELRQRLALAQQRFRDEKLRPWLALARAANIVVHAVALPGGAPHERERAEVLALRTGGTYREVARADALAAEVANLRAELGGQYVISFDAGLAAGDETAFSVTLLTRDERGEKGRYATAPHPVRVPLREAGLGRFARERLYWLEGLVGAPWHLVIAGAAALVALLLLYVFFAGLVGLGKKWFGGAAGKAKKAAKQAVPKGR